MGHMARGAAEEALTLQRPFPVERMKIVATGSERTSPGDCLAHSRKCFSNVSRFAHRGGAVSFPPGENSDVGDRVVMRVSPAV
jgi:hypothetical protein